MQTIYCNSKKLRVLMIGLVTALTLVITNVVPTFAYSNGAYLVSRTTSYANPETGQTQDGGTNVALGDSMCASIVDTQVLVEVVNGKYYVTLGLGLMSNISNIRISVQNSSGGSYSQVGTTLTGSCQRDGDTCNHYRFEVSNPDLYISPTFFVAPMGRDVTFFIKLNMSSMTSGTGNFLSEMVPATTADVVTDTSAGQSNTSSSEKSAGLPDATTDKEAHAQSENETETAVATSQLDGETADAAESNAEATQTAQISAEEMLQKTQGLSIHKVSDSDQSNEKIKNDSQQKTHASNTVMWVVGIVAVVVVVGAGTWIYKRRKRED